MSTKATTEAIDYATPFGKGWVAFDDEIIVETGLPGSERKYPLTRSASPLAKALAAELATYWKGGALPAPSDAMLARAGRTELVREIYEKVVAIRTGSTMTYAAVADSVGHPGAARAVGAAMAANQFAPIIPCHRVVGSDGSLRGYAGGLQMKRSLLEMEASADGG